MEAMQRRCLWRLGGAGGALSASFGRGDEHPADGAELLGDVAGAPLTLAPLVGAEGLGGAAALATAAVEAYLDPGSAPHALDDVKKVSSRVGNDQQVVNGGHRGVAYGERPPEG